VPKKRLREKRGYIVVTAITIVFVALIIISALIQQPAKPKPSVAEYLEIQHDRSVGDGKNNNQSILLKIIGVKIKAVGGDAHYIEIDVDGATERSFIEEIPQGDTKETQILTQGLAIDIENGVFPIPIEVWCSETETETVIVYAKPEELVFLNTE
jgi:hypothetical protein